MSVQIYTIFFLKSFNVKQKRRNFHLFSALQKAFFGVFFLFRDKSARLTVNCEELLKRARKRQLMLRMELKEKFVWTEM